MSQHISTSALIDLGGRQWTSPDTGEVRIYFNMTPLSRFFDLRKLSNRKAAALGTALQQMRFWYEPANGHFHWRVGDYYANQIADIGGLTVPQLAEAIRAKATGADQVEEAAEEPVVEETPTEQPTEPAPLAALPDGVEPSSRPTRTYDVPGTRFGDLTVTVSLSGDEAMKPCGDVVIDGHNISGTISLQYDGSTMNLSPWDCKDKLRMEYPKGIYFKLGRDISGDIEIMRLQRQHDERRRIEEARAATMTALDFTHDLRRTVADYEDGSPVRAWHGDRLVEAHNLTFLEIQRRLSDAAIGVRAFEILKGRFSAAVTSSKYEDQIKDVPVDAALAAIAEAEAEHAGSVTASSVAASTAHRGTPRCYVCGRRGTMSGSLGTLCVHCYDDAESAI